MAPSPPTPLRPTFAFALPPSLGKAAAMGRAERLQGFLTRAIGRRSEVVVADSYDALTKGLLAGRLDAAWAPPFVCARIEALGARVVARAIRAGAASYRAGLVARAGANITLDAPGLEGKVAAWAERDSVGGHLLAVAFLRARGIDPARVLQRQDFVGSYQASLEAVLAGRADLTSVFCLAARPGLPDTTGVGEVLPGRADSFEVLAFTEEAPNDGVAASPALGTPTAVALERSLVELDQSAEGRALLEDVFSLDRFEVAPRMSYRALYRVALASI